MKNGVDNQTGKGISKDFISQIREIISLARKNAVKAVDQTRVMMYWAIGRRIFEEEQNGRERADYGSYLIKNLSIQIEPEYGSGFSVRQLELSRQFYRIFPIANALHSQFNWTHYRSLIRISEESKREYYISESLKNNWNSRELERQIGSQLYERLLVSSDKDKVIAVAKGEKIPENPQYIIKDPMYLEFLGLKRESAYYEKDLEKAILTHT